MYFLFAVDNRTLKPRVTNKTVDVGVFMDYATTLSSQQKMAVFQFLSTGLRVCLCLSVSLSKHSIVLKPPLVPVLLNSAVCAVMEEVLLSHVCCKLCFCDLHCRGEAVSGAVRVWGDAETTAESADCGSEAAQQGL